MKPLRILLCFMIPAIAAQAMAGHVVLEWFAFPVGLLVAVLLTVLLYIWYSERPDSPLLKDFASIPMGVTLLAALAAGCLIIGLVPQAPPSDSPGLWTSFTTSWPFVTVLCLLLAHLELIVLRRIRHRGAHRLRFLLIHGGLWLTILSALFGAADKQHLTMVVGRTEPTRTAYTPDRMVTYTPQTFVLDRFEVDYYANGTPSHFAATVRIDDRPAHIEVNTPYTLEWGKKVYLQGYDTAQGEHTGYCVLQIVTQPWEWPLMAGIITLLLGSLLLLFPGIRKGGQA